MSSIVEHPLAVDLDHTLLRTDTLYESIARMIHKQPWALLLLPFWALRGASHLKTMVARRVQLPMELLPVNLDFLDWLTLQAASGRRLILATAAHQSVADRALTHFKIFEAALGSNANLNLKSIRKAQAINEYLKGLPFSYAGDSRADLPVWEAATTAVLVGATSKTRQLAHRISTVEKEFSRPRASFSVWLLQLRAHQWSKNLLVVAGALAAHVSLTLDVLTTLALAFIAFSACASSVYILNDLLDLEADRKHSKKCLRPLASGNLAIHRALIGLPALLVLAATCASVLPAEFIASLAAYYATTLAYSFYLKKVPVLDCFTLASLYTLRVIGGASALNLGLSVWLLMFSGFLFLSLAFLKRHAELCQASEFAETIPGRGYIADDLTFVNLIGISSGLTSALVLGLYINSPQGLAMYPQAEFLTAGIGVVLFWISWMWFKGNRGEMNEDPVAFAIQDKTSLACGTFFLIAVYMAKLEQAVWV